MTSSMRFNEHLASEQRYQRSWQVAGQDAPESPRDFTVILDVHAKVRPDREFCAEVERLCGAQAIEVLAV